MSLLLSLSDAIAHHGHPVEMPHGDESPAVWEDHAQRALAALERCGQLDALGDALVSLAYGSVVQGLVDSPGRGVLVGELVRHIVDPGRINQGLKGTCAAACLETWLAIQQPVELARVVAGLATEAGAVLLQDGQTVLARDEACLRWDHAERSRSPVSRLFQVAVMELAYPQLDYRNLQDGHYDGEQATPSGLEIGEFDTVLEAVTGQVWEVFTAAQSKRLEKLEALFGLRLEDMPRMPDDVLPIIRRTTDCGDSLFATLVPPRGVIDPHSAPECQLATYAMTHKIRITGVDELEGRVLFDDPMDPTHPWYVGLDTRVLDVDGRSSIAIPHLISVLEDVSYQPRYWVQELAAREAAASSAAVPA